MVRHLLRLQCVGRSLESFNERFGELDSLHGQGFHPVHTRQNLAPSHSVYKHPHDASKRVEAVGVGHKARGFLRVFRRQDHFRALNHGTILVRNFAID